MWASSACCAAAAAAACSRARAGGRAPADITLATQRAVHLPTRPESCRYLSAGCGRQRDESASSTTAVVLTPWARNTADGRPGWRLAKESGANSAARCSPHLHPALHTHTLGIVGPAIPATASATTSMPVNAAARSSFQAIFVGAPTRKRKLATHLRVQARRAQWLASTSSLAQAHLCSSLARPNDIDRAKGVAFYGREEEREENKVSLEVAGGRSQSNNCRCDRSHNQFRAYNCGDIIYLMASILLT